MNDLPDGLGGPADLPAPSWGIPPVEIGAENSDDVAARTRTSGVPDLVEDYSTENIGPGDGIDPLDTSMGDRLRQLHDKVTEARTRAAAATALDATDVRKPWEPAPRPPLPESSPAAETLHGSLHDAVLISTGRTRTPDRYEQPSSLTREQAVSADQLPPTARTLLDQVPVADGAQVSYLQRTTCYEHDGYVAGRSTDAVRMEVAYERREQQSEGDGNEPHGPNTVGVKYSTDQHRAPADTPGEPRTIIYEGRRDVYMPAEFRQPEMSADTIDPAEAAEVARQLQETAQVPEVNETNPATQSDMQELVDVVRDTNAYIGRNGKQYPDKHERPVAAEDIPPHAREALDGLPVRDGAEVSYSQTTAYEGYGTGDQAAIVQFDRHESHEDGRLSGARVRYEVKDHNGHYTMVRITDTTVGSSGTQVVQQTTAIGDYGYRAPGVGVLSRAEAREIIDHAGAAAPEQRVYTPEPLPEQLGAEQMAALPVTGTVDMLPPPDPADVRVLQVNIGGRERAYAGGMVEDVRGGQRVLECTSLRVGGGYEGMGLETRLVSGLVAMAVARRVHVINALADSPAQIDAYSSVATNVGFYGDVDDNGAFVSPMTRDEALAAVNAGMEPGDGVFVRIEARDLIQERLAQPDITGAGARLL